MARLHLGVRDCTAAGQSRTPKCNLGDEVQPKHLAYVERCPPRRASHTTSNYRKTGSTSNAAESDVPQGNQASPCPQLCPLPIHVRVHESTMDNARRMQPQVSSPLTRYFEVEPLRPRELPPTFTSDRAGKHSIAQKLARKEVERVRRGVYSASRVLSDEVDSDRFAQQVSNHLRAISAVCWDLAPGSVLSHTSAALLLGLSGFDVPNRVHCISPTRYTHNPIGMARFRTHVPADQVLSVRGIPTTCLERTVVDSIRVLPLSQGIALADNAIRHGMARNIALRVNAEKTDPRFRAKAQAILQLAAGTSDSPPESYLRLLALRAGGTQWIPQLRVTVDGQNYFPDLADPTIRLALEYDGKVKYDQRDALYREKLREDALRSAGWTVIRFSARDLRDPHAIIMRIRATIRRLGAPTTSLLPVALHQFIGW